MSWLPELLASQSCRVQLVQSDKSTWPQRHFKHVSKEKADLKYPFFFLHNRNTGQTWKLTSDCWLSFKGITLTHFPACLRFGRSLWTPDPVGISLVSTARPPLSAVPPDIKIQSFLIPGLYKPLKQTENMSSSKATCQRNHRGETINYSLAKHSTTHGGKIVLNHWLYINNGHSGHGIGSWGPC